MNGILKLLVVAGLGFGLMESSLAQNIKPHYTSKTRFRIPFKYNADQVARLGIAEVQLYLSTDQGQRWMKHESVSPTQQGFAFQAPSNGTYWFAVKTVDAQGQFQGGSSQMKPGLVVVVDTQRPEANLMAETNSNGQLVITWAIADATVDLETLVLEIKSASSSWVKLNSQPQARGTMTLPVGKPGALQLRLTVKDKAGNETQQIVQTQVGQGGSTAPASTPAASEPSPNRRRVPDFSQPIASRPSNQLAQVLQGSPAYNGMTVPPVDAMANPSRGHSAPPGFVKPGVGAGKSGPSFVSSAKSNIPSVARNRYDTEEQGGNPSENIAITPRTSEQNFPPKRMGTTPRRFVNSNSFQIGYQVEDIGPSGIGDVELFITNDNGRRWWRYGNDTDKRSPINVSVPSDGQYGFQFRIHSGVGITSPPPQPGELPSIVVVVDRTAPSARIMPPQQGSGQKNNQVLITWTANDQNLGPQPIALSYSGSEQGPWLPLTSWIDNTGQYLWDLPPHIPAKLFLQLTVRDEAGNISSVNTYDPLMVDVSHPTARIMDVSTLDESIKR